MIVVNTGTKNKKQNQGSHCNNIHGSEFQKAWITQWLTDPKNTNKDYNEAVSAYIEHKTEIADLWAEPMTKLLSAENPWESYEDYEDLLIDTKNNIKEVAKTLNEIVESDIKYSTLMAGKLIETKEKTWIDEGEKYLTELTKPSSTNERWISKLKRLCDKFQSVTTKEQIVPCLQKIIRYCQYKAGNPMTNDKLPLYMYPSVHDKFDELQKKLNTYSNFVTSELRTGCPHQRTSDEQAYLEKFMGNA